jgi:L-ascorbate metabolism protein UlaG (beta-lactamase superfamily)
MNWSKFLPVLSVLVLGVWTGDASAQTVKITPLGSHTGELCMWDGALLFEDPIGIRILYDIGMAVAGATDPRLGEVHVVLLSHLHGDHSGTRKAAGLNLGTCASPERVSAEPNSNTAEIAAAKNSAVLVSTSMAGFLGPKIHKIRGARPPVGDPSLAPNECGIDTLAWEMTIPRSVPCVGGLQPGSKLRVKRAGRAGGVQIALVQADHSNNVPDSLLTGPERSSLASDSLSAYAGLANGYVLSFTNGLRVYLSGDTAVYGDMKTIINEFYRVNLAVMNLGSFMQSEEAAFAVNQLIQPVSVIPSHVREAATEGGLVRAGTMTEQFIDVVKTSRVHVPRSGRTMEFNGGGRCVTGC